MYMKIVAIAATLLLATAQFAQPAHAEGNAMAGKELAYTCLGCHGSTVEVRGMKKVYTGPTWGEIELCGRIMGPTHITPPGES